MMIAMLEAKSEYVTKDEVLYDGYEQFWVLNKAKFPQSFQLYRIFLSAPATSISVESLFSAMSHVFTDKRRSMSEKKLGQMALANAWFRTPRVVSGGRSAIIWPVTDGTVEPPKRLAEELAHSLQQEEEVAAIEMVTEEETAEMRAPPTDLAQVAIDGANALEEDLFIPAPHPPPVVTHPYRTRKAAWRRTLPADD